MKCKEHCNGCLGRGTNWFEDVTYSFVVVQNNDDEPRAALALFPNQLMVYTVSHELHSDTSCALVYELFLKLYVWIFHFFLQTRSHVYTKRLLSSCYRCRFANVIKISYETYTTYMYVLHMGRHYVADAGEAASELLEIVCVCARSSLLLQRNVRPQVYDRVCCMSYVVRCT